MSSSETDHPKRDRGDNWLLCVLGVAFTFGLVVLFMPASCDTNITVSRSKKVRALATCTELEQAVQRFYDDNGTYPVEIPEDATFSSNSEKGLEMLRVLMNRETVGPPLNGKGINYLGHAMDEGYIDGFVWNKSGSQVIGLNDPWGGPYMIAIDGDYSESIWVRPKAVSYAKMLQRRVAVWSNGKDAEDRKDDVTTW